MSGGSGQRILSRGHIADSVQRCVKSRRLVCAKSRVLLKVALKCLIAVVLVDVDLPHWTSKVKHLVAFAATVSNICSAHAQKRLFMHFRCKFTIRYDTIRDAILTCARKPT